MHCNRPGSESRNALRITKCSKEQRRTVREKEDRGQITLNQSEFIWQLKFEIHNLEAELESHKKGNAIKKLRASYNGVIIRLKARIKELEHEVAKAQNETVFSRKAWFVVFDDLDKEHKKELDEKDREIARLKERIFEIERQRDAALDKARDKQHAYLICLDLHLLWLWG